ncbi:hypothetical protein PG994_006640 [Apiospora phragmitis]|uniref:Uncharacterized protein n=1 Tax=Apiospora phragmitis TaxID=2905665 RepID=A0ABR1VJ85_9PEZI
MLQEGANLSLVDIRAEALDRAVSELRAALDLHEEDAKVAHPAHKQRMSPTRPRSRPTRTGRSRSAAAWTAPS